RMEADELVDTIETFKKAHLEWVHRVETMLNGGQSFTPQTHTECSLGRWYQGRGQLDWGQMPEFQAIAAPHETLHQLLFSIHATHRSGDKSATQRLLAQLKQLSREVVNKLDALEQQSAIQVSQSVAPAKPVAPKND